VSHNYDASGASPSSITRIETNRQRRPSTVARFVIIAVYVVVPTTVVVLTATFVLPNVMSGRVVLLAYVLPIGAARVWLQDDAVETVLQHQE
jgi:hypothetical protein